MADKDRVSQVRDTLKKMQKNLECPICLELLSDPYTTRCGHPFCRICIYTVISSNREARCPLCKEPISKRSMNENCRLGEIVEAVKQLEQAIIEDTGIPKTPPRPLPPHSHEATGSPGIALHSKLHPSPRKKPHPRSKRTKSKIDLSASKSSKAALSIFDSPAQHESTEDTRNDTTESDISKPEDRGGRGKLSIKHRRKKVKFTVEKPTALLHVARKVPTSSPKMESAASSSRNLLSMFTEEEERMETGNGKLEAAAEQAGIENRNGNVETIYMEEVSDSRNEDENEGASYPVRKKTRLDSSPLVSAKINTSLSQEVPYSSQQLGSNVSRILETPAPQIRRKNFTVSISRVILSNRFAIRPEIDSNKPNEREEKNCNNALNQGVGSPQPTSSKLCAASSMSKDQGIELYRPQPLAIAMRETPFVQASGLSSGSSVTRVMETPFISNIQVPSDDERIVTDVWRSSDYDHNVEQCESMLANVTVEDSHTPTLYKAQTPTENVEDLFSDSILVKETQDADHPLKSNQLLSDDSLATGGSCTVLGPTQVTSVPESQFSLSAIIPRPRTVSHQLSQVVDASPCSPQEVEEEHKMQTQHDSKSSNESQSSVVCSPVQSGGTVYIGETQFTKSESRPSPEEGRPIVVIPPTGMCTLPSPPVSPSKIQSPIIPLQNSNPTHLPHSCSAIQVSQQPPSGVVSKIAETQFSTSSDHGIVPSSQPSPTPSKRQPAASLRLPGLTMVQYRKPQPQATVVDGDRISPQPQEKEKYTKQNSESQTLPVYQGKDEDLTKSPLTVEQNQSKYTAESTTALAPTHSNDNGACMNRSVSSMSLAYSSLQSQRASLQSQISSSLDLSSQQLELLRLEMEAKQREIDELEAALRQVEEEEKEIQHESPAASTQSSVRSITAIAETMPSSNGQMVSPDRVNLPEHRASESIKNPLSDHSKNNTAVTDNVETVPSNICQTPSQEERTLLKHLSVYAPEFVENPLSDHAKSQEHSQVAVLPALMRSPDVYALESIDIPILSGHAESSEHSQVDKSERSLDEAVPESLVMSSQHSREPRSMEHSQVRVSTSPFSLQIPSEESTIMKIRAVVKRTVPNSHKIAAVVTPEDLNAHTSNIAMDDSSVEAKSAGKTAGSTHSEIESDTESDTNSEAPRSSLSVLATLQAADDVLKKLRSPPLAVLEERSSMEIDTDLYSIGTPAPHRTSFKAKKLRASTDAAKPTGVNDKAQRDTINSVHTACTLEVDSRLCTSSTKEEISTNRSKGSTSTSRGKRAYGTSTKSKSKKTKKAPLVLFESEDTALARLPEFRNQNQATASKSPSNAVTGAKPSELNPSSPSLPSVAQSPDRGCSSREGGRGSTTLTYGAVVLQTPKAGQCSSNSGTAATSSGSGSPCRPLSNVGKDHPPSYIGSGLSKTQLREVQALARRFGGRLASCFNGSTSHVIVSADENGLCPRTVKYLQGVATGRWIINHQWVTESLDAGRLLPENEYEVVGDHVTTTITRAPMRSRQLHLKESPGLFADYAFLFIGAFGGISQDHLAQLIQLSGGSLVSNIEKSTTLGNSRTCVVCDERRIQLPESGSGQVHVKSEWILNCLSNYSVLPIPSSQCRQDDS